MSKPETIKLISQKIERLLQRSCGFVNIVRPYSKGRNSVRNTLNHVACSTSVRPATRPRNWERCTHQKSCMKDAVSYLKVKENAILTSRRDGIHIQLRLMLH